MTLTQAQIDAAQQEAAVKAIKPILDDLYAHGWEAKYLDRVRIVQAALTAAAEVGEKEFDPQDWVNDVKRFEACIAATIERCAQVADAYLNDTARRIAAAIRALATEGK